MNVYCKEFMDEAIRLAIENAVTGNGGPFGAVIVKNNQIIARGYNRVTELNDPTAHAEVTAIREACRRLDNFELEGCQVYSSCEPCPMCLGAIYWSRPAAVYFAATREDAAQAGFDDAMIYSEINSQPENRKILTSQQHHANSNSPFKKWNENSHRKPY